MYTLNEKHHELLEKKQISVFILFRSTRGLFITVKHTQETGRRQQYSQRWQRAQNRAAAAVCSSAVLLVAPRSNLTSAATRKVSAPMPSENDHMKRHSPLRVIQAGAEAENEIAAASKHNNDATTGRKQQQNSRKQND